MTSCVSHPAISSAPVVVLAKIELEVGSFHCKHSHLTISIASKQKNSRRLSSDVQVGVVLETSSLRDVDRLASFIMQARVDFEAVSHQESLKNGACAIHVCDQVFTLTCNPLSIFLFITSNCNHNFLFMLN